MSHFTTIKTQIKEIQALRAACDEKGLTDLKVRKAAFERRSISPFMIGIAQSQPDFYVLIP